MGWLAETIQGAFKSGALPLGDWSGGWTDFSSGQSKLKDAINRYENSSKALTTWEALNLPTLQKQGLMDAGFNPILALGNLGSGMASALSATHSGAGQGIHCPWARLHTVTYAKAHGSCNRLHHQGIPLELR